MSYTTQSQVLHHVRRIISDFKDLRDDFEKNDGKCYFWNALKFHELAQDFILIDLPAQALFKSDDMLLKFINCNANYVWSICNTLLGNTNLKKNFAYDYAINATEELDESLLKMVEERIDYLKNHPDEDLSQDPEEEYKEKYTTLNDLMKDYVHLYTDLQNYIKETSDSLFVYSGYEILSFYFKASALDDFCNEHLQNKVVPKLLYRYLTEYASKCDSLARTLMSLHNVPRDLFDSTVAQCRDSYDYVLETIREELKSIEKSKKSKE